MNDAIYLSAGGLVADVGNDLASIFPTFISPSWLPWLGFFCGLILVLVTAKSVMNTIILPRVTSSQITFGTYQLTFATFHMMGKRLRQYEQKDRLLAYLVPVMIILTLLIWLLLFLLGYALMFWPLVGDFGGALRLSGSSIFTLGVASSGYTGPIVLEFLAAATGLIVVALQIGYLPTLYGAYNRREILVTALSSRAGAPAWGPEILARHHLSVATASLPAMYANWETLAADIAESHSSYPWLMGMRSPSPLNCWVISMLAVLDSATLARVSCFRPFLAIGVGWLTSRGKSRFVFCRMRPYWSRVVTSTCGAPALWGRSITSIAACAGREPFQW